MSRLVVDAGGTNVRFAVADMTGALDRVRTYRVEDYPAFADALFAYRTDSGGFSGIEAAAIAGAGPVDGTRVKLTNNAWTIDGDDVARSIGNGPVALVNDLEAVALALPHLALGDLHAIGTPAPLRPEQRPMLAFNVGTGLGAASIRRRGSQWWTCPTEAGHMMLGLASADEAAVLPSGESIESVLSGRGLARLHARLAGADDTTATLDAAAVVARAARDRVAARAVDLFTRVLGRIAGDLVLATTAWGGVYLCGSVAVAWSAVADAAEFRAEFTRKGPMQSRMMQVPAAVIRHNNVALLGLAMMPLPD